MLRSLLAFLGTLTLAAAVGSAVPHYHEREVGPDAAAADGLKVDVPPVNVTAASVEHHLAIQRENVVMALACFPHAFSVAASYFGRFRRSTHRCGTAALMITAGLVLLILAPLLAIEPDLRYWVGRTGLWFSGIGHSIVLGQEADKKCRRLIASFRRQEELEPEA